jgi:hypothetical protein
MIIHKKSPKCSVSNRYEEKKVLFNNLPAALFQFLALDVVFCVAEDT